MDIFSKKYFTDRAVCFIKKKKNISPIKQQAMLNYKGVLHPPVYPRIPSRGPYGVTSERT